MINNFTDNEILKWNDRLKYHQLNIIIRPRYVSNSIHNPAIGFNLDIMKNGISHWGTNLYNETSLVPEPHIKYNLIFSIDIDKVDKFNEIYDEIKLREIRTPISDAEDIRNININNVQTNLITEKHSLFKKEYVKFDYTFEGKLGDIMGYVKNINDSIYFLQLKYKFKISEVVSDIKDRSIDYLVLKHDYTYTGVNYKLIEIVSNSADTIIEYGRLFNKEEKFLTWSRTTRIDEVINNE